MAGYSRLGLLEVVRSCEETSSSIALKTLSIQSIQKVSGSDEIACREAFLVAREEWFDQGTRLAGAPVVVPELAEGDCSAQLPAQGALPTRQDQRFLKIAFCLRRVTGMCQNVSLDPEHFRHVEGLAVIADLGDGVVDQAQRLLGLILQREALCLRSRKRGRHDPMPGRIKCSLAAP